MTWCRRCQREVTRLVAASFPTPGDRPVCEPCAEAIENEPTACEVCGGTFPRKDVASDPDLSHRETTQLTCRACWSSLWDRYARSCDVCGARWVAKHYSFGGCPVCTGKERTHQPDYVERHMGRARLAGRPATLTQAEWLHTLHDFSDRCAYCLEGPVEAMDHYLPLSRGGGTTATNCVPVCFPCNASKGDADPRVAAHGRRITVEAIARVGEYLRRRAAGEPTAGLIEIPAGPPRLPQPPESSPHDRMAESRAMLEAFVAARREANIAAGQDLATRFASVDWRTLPVEIQDAFAAFGSAFGCYVKQEQDDPGGVRREAMIAQVRADAKDSN